MPKQILLTQGKFAIVDDEDYENLKKYKWFAVRDKKTFYAMRHKGKNEKKSIRMHRQVMKPLPEFQIDHINGNGLDNRKSNLRICTLTENTFNRKKCQKSKSKYKGVSWDKSKNKWRARIKLNSKDIHIGRYDSEIDAAVAYDRKAKELFGKFARTNF